MRSGFATVVGRPNVGKSTLINCMVGSKVSITSARPNTTRHTVRGVLHRPDAQVVFVDTPGIHRPRTALGERLNDTASSSLRDVDVVVALVDATAAVGPGDRIVLARALDALQRTAVEAGRGAADDDEEDAIDGLHLPQGARSPVAGATGVPASPPGPRPDGAASDGTDRATVRAPTEPPLMVVVNKVDAARPEQVVERLATVAGAVDQLLADRQWGEDHQPEVEYFPVSATTGEGVGALVEAIVGRLPEGPAYYPTDMITDTPDAQRVAELVREQLLVRARDELPHAIACRVTEWEWPRIRCEILVERDSQKAIVIGKGGEVLKAVGTAVRAELPPGAYLELFVRVEKRWQQRRDALDRLGY
jgi:GTP-binding protein Era